MRVSLLRTNISQITQIVEFYFKNFYISGTTVENKIINIASTNKVLGNKIDFFTDKEKYIHFLSKHLRPNVPQVSLPVRPNVGQYHGVRRLRYGSIIRGCSAFKNSIK